ncbi:integrin-linked protein kinase 1-like [Cynara cardunculus var. scolymus]|uniref:integrin-linked protein kinase 1-like n=1 Tax=Cynara cardunculus var. scolymus TaxID=59895 RepID=UPI000D62840E|nr:integrin-linked protein kinase 1-like [Cynara cardunculus var. scolymus]
MDVSAADPPSSPSMQQMQVQKSDTDGPYRLLYCSSKGNKWGVMQELDKGVEPNVGDYDRRKALHLAACEGCTEIVLLLLEKGADVNSTDRWGRTPLSDARSLGHLEICKILEAHGGTDPQGAFGEVYKVKWRGTEVAAKTIRSSIASNETVRKAFLKELALWQTLRHPNIVQFLGVLTDSDRLIFLTDVSGFLPFSLALHGNNRSTIWGRSHPTRIPPPSGIYWAHLGSLYDILKKKGRLEPVTAVSYALDIARGMNYLHQHRPHAIIHRDLTPRNVLQDEAGRLKVTDFGLSKIAQEKDVYGYKMTGGTGSYRYMAPEVYRRESYGKSVDVFSFALIVHEGRPSNREEPPEHVADKRAYEDSRPPLPSYYPERIRELLKQCWHRNPAARPMFETIITDLESILENEQRKVGIGSCHSCLIL